MHLKFQTFLALAQNLNRFQNEKKERKILFHILLWYPVSKHMFQICLEEQLGYFEKRKADC